MSVTLWTQVDGRLLPRIDVRDVAEGESAGVVETRVPSGSQTLILRSAKIAFLKNGRARDDLFTWDKMQPTALMSHENCVGTKFCHRVTLHFHIRFGLNPRSQSISISSLLWVITKVLSS